MLSQKFIEYTHQLLEDCKNKSILAEKTKLESLWVGKYNLLKDSTWPNCFQYSDFYNLDVVIQKELVEFHNFSPEIWFESLTLNTKHSYDITTKSSISHQILMDHVDVIKNKTIIDFACHTGEYSFYCHDQGCKFVQGIEIRPEAVEIARGRQIEYGILNHKIKFDIGDIHNYSAVKNLCADKDTVLLCGIMYHVHDHLEILQAVCQPSVQYIVIETLEHPSIMDIDQPLVWWGQEHTAIWTSGFYQNQDMISIGIPNLSWFKFIMSTLQFDLVDSARHIENTHYSRAQEFNQHRSIQIYKRVM